YTTLFRSKVDAQAKDVSRMFYTPAIADEGARYRYEIHNGLMLDWRALDLPEIEQPRPAPVSSDKGDAYGRKALESEASRVLLATEGERNAQLNRSAFALGQLVAGGALERWDVEATLERAATGAGLDRQEIKATIRSGIEAGMKEPRTAPERPHQGRSRTAPDIAKNEAEKVEQQAVSGDEFPDMLAFDGSETVFDDPDLLADHG